MFLKPSTQTSPNILSPPSPLQDVLFLFPLHYHVLHNDMVLSDDFFPLSSSLPTTTNYQQTTLDPTPHLPHHSSPSRSPLISIGCTQLYLPHLLPLLLFFYCNVSFSLFFLHLFFFLPLLCIPLPTVTISTSIIFLFFFCSIFPPHFPIQLDTPSELVNHHNQQPTPTSHRNRTTFFHHQWVQSIK